MNDSNQAASRKAEGLSRGRICIVTSEHLYANPRAVKEADALAEAGFDVRVVACRYSSWMATHDDELMETRTWRLDRVDWGRETEPALFWWSRIRQNLFRRLARFTLRFGIAEAAAGRVVKELTARAAAEPADLIIGHNLPALPAAVEAADRLGCAAGFDAEDLHSAMWLERNGSGLDDRVALFLEQRYLPRCIHLTSAAPLISREYEKRDGRPVACVLNVFPLSMQPPAPAESGGCGGALRLYWFSQTIGRDRGLEDVVDAMARLRGLHIELHLRGAWQPGYEESIRGRVAAAGLPAGCLQAHAPAPPDQMAHLAAEFDVGLALEHAVSHNRDICLTNKIFTYLLAGNAVVATATQGQRDLCTRLGSSVAVFQPGDVTTLAGCLRYWHDDRAALFAARQVAWKLGRTEYNWDVEKAKWISLVETSLQHAREGHA